MKDYYKEIDTVLKDYENFRNYHTRDIDWACDKIAWCAQWKKLPSKQIDELADRATAILDNITFNLRRK